MALRTEQQGGIHEIVLAQPQVHNAVGPDEARAIRLAIEAASAAPDVRVVVLSAEGKSFCAGGNLRQIVDMVAGGASVVTETIYAEFQGMMRAIEAMRPPLFCAVDGAAIGLGCDLALAGDLTFVGENGAFAQGWAALGLVPAPGGTRLIVRRGGTRALWRLMSERRIGPAEAERLGLALAVNNARAAALQAAATVASLPAEAVSATKRLSRIEGFNEHLKVALEYQTDFLTSAAFAARADAILNRKAG
jgi:enoyl-CoA hydratase/carnithine racemase